MDLTASALWTLGLGAAVAYGLLRFNAYKPGTSEDALRAVRRHGMWTALIALFASGCGNTEKYDRLGPDFSSAASTFTDRHGLIAVLVDVTVPLIALGAVYVLAQFSWRRAGACDWKSVRLVDRARTLMPWKLLSLTVGVGLPTACLVGAAAFLPGVPGGTNYTGTISMTFAARVPGAQFAIVLGATLLVLGLSVTVAALAVIGRRPFMGLVVEDDMQVRRISLNRLFRTTTLALAGIISATSAYSRNGLPTDQLHQIGTPSIWGSLGDPIMFFCMALLIAVILWKPPLLHRELAAPATLPTAAAGTYARALQISDAGRRIGFALLLLIGIPTAVAMFVMPPGTALLVLIASGYSMFLMVQLGVELVIRRNHAPGSRAYVSSWGSVPVWLLTALVLSIAAALYSVILLVLAAPGAGGELVPSFAAVVVLVLLGIIAAWACLTRPKSLHADTAQDRLLRAVTLHRIVRSLTSAMLVLTAYLIGTQSLTLATLFDIYQPPSAGMAPELFAAQSVMLAFAAVVLLLPGPMRRTGSATPSESASLYR
ncbi:hypothetical protein GCM10027403_01130 [Arthrobacter tecti]